MAASSRPASNPGTVRADGGTVQESHVLRKGNRLDVTSDAIVVERDDETIRFAFDNIVEVSHDTFDFFLSILSIALVGFGVLSLERNVPLGLVFTAAGILSLYRTYDHRGQLKFRIQGRAKPLIVYPEHADDVYAALEPYVAAD